MRYERRVGLGDDEAAWIELLAPDEAEIEAVVRVHGMVDELVRDALDPRELPRVQSRGRLTLMVLRAPVSCQRRTSRRRERPVSAPFTTAPFGVLLGEGIVVTVAADDHPALIELRARAGEVGCAAELALVALQIVSRLYQAALKELEERVDGLEDQIGTSLGNDAVLELLACDKSYTLFSTALSSTERAIERLGSAPLFAMHVSKDALDDVHVEIQQASETTRTASEVLGGLMDAFASMISNNLNNVVRRLTSLTIVLTVPTAVSGFYGMNVPLPGEHASATFGSVVGGSVLATALTAWLFRRIGWL